MTQSERDEKAAKQYSDSLIRPLTTPTEVMNIRKHFLAGCRHKEASFFHERARQAEIKNNVLESVASMFDMRHPADTMDIGAVITYKQVSQFIRTLKDAQASDLDKLSSEASVQEVEQSRNGWEK